MYLSANSAATTQLKDQETATHSKQNNMRIGCVGPGALGSLFAARLCATKQNVQVSLLCRPLGASLFQHDGKQLEQLIITNRPGLADLTLPITRADMPCSAQESSRYLQLLPSFELAAPLDIVLMLVKGVDTFGAMHELCKGAGIGPDTVIISLQNGIGNVDTMRRVCANRETPTEPIIFQGVTYVGAKVASPGVVECAGAGATRLPSASALTQTKLPEAAITRTSKLVSLLSESESWGGPVCESSDMDSVMWKKLIVNAVVNPITAILNVPNGELVNGNQTIQSLAKRATQEAFDIAMAGNVSLDWKTSDEAWDFIRNVCTVTATNTSSMLADVQQHRPTEVQTISGGILKYSQEWNVPAPTHQTLRDLVCSISESQGHAVSEM